MESFIDTMLQLSQDLPAAKAMLQQGAVRRTVPKGTILQQAGDSSVKAFFVRRGCLRSYTIDAKGKEHIFMFAPERWIVGDIVVPPFGSPTQFFVDAIEDCELEELDHQLFDGMLKENPTLSTFAVAVFQKRIAVLQKRVIMLLSATATERYNDFCATYPSIVQRVPQKMIASYLGVTPEALSKIRGELSKGNR